MILTCPNCNSRYLVSDTAIPPGGRAVRCAACKHVWTQHPATEEPRALELAGAEAAPAPAAAAAAEPAAAPVPPAEAPQPAAAAASPFPAGPMPRLGTPESDDEETDAAPEPAPRHRLRASRSRSGKKWQPGEQRRSFPVKWVVIGTTAVLAVGLNVVLWKDTLVERSDMFRSFYAAMGMATPVPHDASIGAQVLRISYPPPPPARLLENGNLSQEITGSIENPTNRTVRIPNLKGTMLDENNNVVFTWTFPPPMLVLNGGETVMFDTRVENFPSTARQLRIGFDTGTDAGVGG